MPDRAKPIHVSFQMNVNNYEYVPPLKRQNAMITFKRTRDFEHELAKCLIQELEAKKTRQETEDQGQANQGSQSTPDHQVQHETYK